MIHPKSERFKLTIELGTYPELVSIQEIATALRKVAGTIERDGVEESGWPHGPIYDHLRRKISEWEITTVK